MKQTAERTKTGLMAAIPADVPDARKAAIVREKERSFNRWMGAAAFFALCGLGVLGWLIHLFGKELTVTIIAAGEAIPVMLAAFCAAKADDEYFWAFFGHLLRLKKEAQS